MLARQVRHEFVNLLRTPITVILSVGFPLLFFVLLAALVGNQVIDEATGVRLVQYLAPGLAAFGVAMATFSFLAYGFAEARQLGVLKRRAATPAPAWVLLGGRIGAALALGLVAVGLIVGVGVGLYGLQVYGRSVLPVLLAILVASLTFSAWGLALALMLPSSQATLAVTNGFVVVMSFVSDMFNFGGQIPAWLDRVGWVFPFKHLVAVLSDALNPNPTGASPWAHLGVIAAWGLGGFLVAGWLLRSGRDRMPARAVAANSGATTSDRAPRRDGSAPTPALLSDQIGHAQSVLWRDPGSVFFAVAFPVLLVAIIPTVNGGGDVRLPNGDLLSTFYVATMAIYGAAVTAYVNMPQALAEARERGVLKRMHATPLPTWTLLVGRAVGALVVALLTLVAVAVVAAVLFRPPVPPTWPGAVLTFVVATVCFAVLGLAVISLVRSAQAAIGVALGTLLPLSFISDVFVVGVTLPPMLDFVSWVFPLRHASRAMTEAVSVNATGWGLSAPHLAALLLWTATGAAVVARRFRWEVREAGKASATSRPVAVG